MSNTNSSSVSATKATLSAYNGARVLAVDAGGTHFRAGYGEVREGRFELLRQSDYPSRELISAEQGLDRFLCETSITVDFGCLGVAGPVQNNIARLTNLHWTVDSNVVARLLSVSRERCHVVNDMVSITRGALLLPDSDIIVLNEGAVDPQGNVAVIAAGTGLGQAGAYYVPELGRYRALPSEGGHSLWAPPNPELDALLPIMRKLVRRVSCEEVLSGRGLYNLYSAFMATPGEHVGLTFSADQDPNAAIAEAALMKTNQICERSVQALVQNYGAEAGNLALTLKSTGGVFIAGGIATKLLPLIKEEGRFMKAFRDLRSDGSSALPANHSEMLAQMPVKLITDGNVGMLGAAACALEGP